MSTSSLPAAALASQDSLSSLASQRREIQARLSSPDLSGCSCWSSPRPPAGQPLVLRPCNIAAHARARADEAAARMALLAELAEVARPLLAGSWRDSDVAQLAAMLGVVLDE